MDAVDELIRTSQLSAPSPEAAAAAWREALRIAREAWPAVELDEAELAPFVGERIAGSTGDLVAALAAAPIADLALAGACAAGEPTAHAAFDTVLTEVDAAGASTRGARPRRRARGRADRRSRARGRLCGG